METAGFPIPEAERHWVEAAERLAPEFAARAAEHDERATLPIENLRALHAAGLDLAVLPAAHGGADLSYLALGEILGVVAKACPSTACVWMMHLGAAATLVRYGNPAAAAFYAAELAAGRRFANALSEPSGGNLFLFPLQEAVPAGGGHRLDGAKRFVSGCEIADHFLVNAQVGGEPAFFGVPRDDSVRLVPIWDAMGMRATRSQLVELDGALLRAENRCTGIGRTDPNIIALGLPWLSVGVAEAALDATVAHARSRTIPTTGQAIAELQWVEFGVAQAHVRALSARLLAQRAMWLADRRDAGALNAAVEAKLHANEVAKQVAELALKVGGGSGYLRTSPLQRHFRDAQAGALMAFSAEVCQGAIGNRLLSGP
ncbi:acyl-CoA dehydrogenase family protein [Amycolatopsis anabasis]|uniref:acyl-CoA dehydrogenase family protein n=1 Tax=Amycolatopsis anabasis TaxID=1840409 RepID=UPI0015D2450D|nr:acyl-CoA dehydrogenase family protein [Amycolatopsis anabasis]